MELQQSDHVHMLISIPPKYAVSQVVGCMKGQSAIYVALNFGNRRKNLAGEKFWARGYLVSTCCCRDDEDIRQYIQHQKHEYKRLDQLKLFD